MIIIIIMRNAQEECICSYMLEVLVVHKKKFDFWHSEIVSSGFLFIKKISSKENSESIFACP